MALKKTELIKQWLLTSSCNHSCSFSIRSFSWLISSSLCLTCCSWIQVEYSAVLSSVALSCSSLASRSWAALRRRRFRRSFFTCRLHRRRSAPVFIPTHVSSKKTSSQFALTPNFPRFFCLFGLVLILLTDRTCSRRHSTTIGHSN